MFPLKVAVLVLTSFVNLTVVAMYEGDNFNGCLHCEQLLSFIAAEHGRCGGCGVSSISIKCTMHVAATDNLKL